MQSKPPQANGWQSWPARCLLCSSYVLCALGQTAEHVDNGASKKMLGMLGEKGFWLYDPKSRDKTKGQPLANSGRGLDSV